MAKYAIRIERLIYEDKPHYFRTNTPIWCSNWTRNIEDLELFKSIKAAENKLKEFPAHFPTKIIPSNVAKLDLLTGIQ